MDFVQFVATAEAAGTADARFHGPPADSPSISTGAPEDVGGNASDADDRSRDDAIQGGGSDDDHHGDCDEEASDVDDAQGDEPARRHTTPQDSEAHSEEESGMGSPETPPQLPRQTWATELQVIQGMRRDTKACTALWHLLDGQCCINPQVCTARVNRASRPRSATEPVTMSVLCSTVVSMHVFTVCFLYCLYFSIATRQHLLCTTAFMLVKCSGTQKHSHQHSSSAFCSL